MSLQNITIGGDSTLVSIKQVTEHGVGEIRIPMDKMSAFIHTLSKVRQLAELCGPGQQVCTACETDGGAA